MVTQQLNDSTPILSLLCLQGKEKAADQRRRMLAGGTQSDHLMLVRAYQGWEKAQRRGDAQHYCFDNFLSQNTLKVGGTKALCRMRGKKPKRKL